MARFNKETRRKIAVLSIGLSPLHEFSAEWGVAVTTLDLWRLKYLTEEEKLRHKELCAEKLQARRSEKQKINRELAKESLGHAGNLKDFAEEKGVPLAVLHYVRGNFLSSEEKAAEKELQKKHLREVRAPHMRKVREKKLRASHKSLKKLAHESVNRKGSVADFAREHGVAPQSLYVARTQYLSLKEKRKEVKKLPDAHGAGAFLSFKKRIDTLASSTDTDALLNDQKEEITRLSQVLIGQLETLKISASRRQHDFTTTAAALGIAQALEEKLQSL